jgi:hypothetical protein
MIQNRLWDRGSITHTGTNQIQKAAMSSLVKPFIRLEDLCRIIIGHSRAQIQDLLWGLRALPRWGEGNEDRLKRR